MACSDFAMPFCWLMGFALISCCYASVDLSDFKLANTIGKQLPSSNISSNSSDLVELLYPALKKDPSMPVFTTDYVYAFCDQFAPNRTAPPNPPPTNVDPTFVQSLFSIDRLVKFEDVQETMKVSALLLLYWNIPCNQSLQLLSTPPQRLFVSKQPDKQELKDNVWLPGYIFTSSSADIFMKSEEFGTDLVATANNWKKGGTLFEFYYARRGFFEAQCELHLEKFPFDTQWCPFSFAFQRSDNLIQFDQYNAYPICPSAAGTEWVFTQCGSEIGQAKLSGNNVSTVSFKIVMTRKPDFYVINLALPSICLSLLELATFLMPPDKPDRPTFAVTIVLALTVAQSDVLKDVPKTSNRILLSDYILLLSWFSSLVTFYEMLGCCLSHYNNGNKFMKRQVKIGFTCSYLRAFDVVAFIVSVLAYAGINGYAAYIITRPTDLKSYSD